MKFILIYLITIYQKLLSPLYKQLLGVNSICRFPVSCSAYAKNAITQHGANVGIRMSIKRLLSCQPFSNRYKYEYNT